MRNSTMKTIVLAAAAAVGTVAALRASVADTVATPAAAPASFVPSSDFGHWGLDLAARDPANTEWQRDLSLSHGMIGDVLKDQGDGLGALYAGVVDEDVEITEVRDHLREAPFDLGFLGDIDPHGEGATPARLYLGDQARGLVVARNVEHRDVGTFVGVGQRHRAADAGVAAGYERGAPHQSIKAHATSLKRRPQPSTRRGSTPASFRHFHTAVEMLS